MLVLYKELSVYEAFGTSSESAELQSLDVGQLYAGCVNTSLKENHVRVKGCLYIYVCV